MAKRSKKKNPNALSEKAKADIRYNQELDCKINLLGKKLNITLAVVIAIAVISFLFLPVINMNFSGSLSEILGDAVTQENDQEMAITLDMTDLDILFAMSKGYSDSIEYIANTSASGIGATVLYNAFMTKVTESDVEMLDFAYIVSFALAILLLAAIVTLIAIATVGYRKNNRDGVAYTTAVIIFSAIATVQWICFVAVGIASAGKGQIQPHIGSYLLLASAITLCVVYGLYRTKVKKLIRLKKPIETTPQDKGEK